jgi:hypothetical protein
VRLEHGDDATSAHDRPRGFQYRRDLSRVVSVIIEEAHPTKLPVELESTIRSTKPTDCIGGLWERQTRID